MKRLTVTIGLAAALALSAVADAQAGNPRLDDAELKISLKLEQRERAKLDDQWNAIQHTPALMDEQKRWESATEKVCAPNGSSVQHRSEASQCKSRRYRLRRTNLAERFGG